MVESNHDEERLSRIEDMVERLRRENAANRIVTAKLAATVAQAVADRARPRASTVRRRVS